MSGDERTGPSTAQADALERLLTDRWSCRSFLPETVPHQRIERLLDIARRSPSWCNTQPWTTYVTSGNATNEFRTAVLAEAARGNPAPDIEFPPCYTGTSRQRRKAVARQLYDSLGIAEGDRTASNAQTAKNFEFFGAPHVAIVTSRAELGTYGVLDCGIYVNSFLLAAHSLGLGAISQAALAIVSPAVRTFFDIDSHEIVVCGISFGWPDLDHPANRFRTTRAGLEETVVWRT
ncbi:nitroreductase [Mycolicibacterium hodleri]|uniref:Nitroreductase n=1 Tax=Mycolicibacterium hodleri TaxID=49897 RepID=A0A502E7L2_9MYCO|nr:nitroreductase [Mycolicibacterium hodleri]TPG32441.1 nitroreductase [Mycolicibacterium hodleri]